MKKISPEQLSDLLKQVRIKPRIVNDLRFQSDLIDDWGDLELLAVWARSGNEGVLIVPSDESAYDLLPFTFTHGLTNNQTGRSKSVICDFCYTYQSGGGAGRITFTRKDGLRSLSFLCCADLQCSRHVRSKTSASLQSRTQLHEDLTTQQRVDRLKSRLRQLLPKYDAQYEQ